MADKLPPKNQNKVQKKKSADKSAAPRVAFVLPCYNEEEALAKTIPTLLDLLSTLERRGLVHSSSYLYFCDDGSSDATWEVLRSFRKRDAKNRSKSRKKFRVCALRFVANCGREMALYAGLVKQVGACDWAISLDADLQDDLSLVPRMLKIARKGEVDIVSAIRKDRHSDGLFKRLSASLFYFSLRFFFRVPAENEADFRLMSQSSLRALALYRERRIYLRGLVSRMGFPTARLYYERQERIGGETKYTLRKMIGLALDGITSQSTHPLRVVFFLGVAMFFGCLGLAGYFFYQWFSGQTLAGWASVVLLILFVSSLQSLALGVVGEYLGKVFLEVRGNPRYLIEEEMTQDEACKENSRKS